MSDRTAYWLYVVFALGGVGLHAMLPRRQAVNKWFGAGVGLCALAAFVAVLAWRVVVADSTTGYFYLFSTLAIFSAVRVITHTKPVYSALYFVLTVVAVACLLVLLHAEFLAVATIIIYAGAILVTYLFVIMLAQQSGAPIYDRSAREPLASVFAGFILVAAIAGRASETSPTAQSTATLAAAPSVKADATIPEGNSASVGAMLMTRHVVATQLSAVLLLISMVGAIALSKKRIISEATSEETPRLGQVGRDAKPF